MILHGAGAMQRHAARRRELPRFDVEVVEHFDVITDEPDRHDDGFGHSVVGQALDRLQNVRLEPRILWPTAAALIREKESLDAETLRHGPRCSGELLDVGRSL